MSIDQRRGDRLAGRLPAPKHELKHGVEALALFDGRFSDGFGLLKAEMRFLLENARQLQTCQASTILPSRSSAPIQASPSSGYASHNLA